MGGVCLLCALSACANGSAAPAPPSPTFAKTVVLQPVSGTVLVRTPGAPYSMHLTAALTVPVGTVVDTTAGRVRLTSANPAPASLQSGQFFGGTFQVRQTRSGGGLVSLVLRDTVARQSGCKPPPAHAAALSKRLLGLLRGSAKGHFRTVGRFSAATVLGTNWGVRDLCDGTVTVVREGVVTVQDFVHHKTVVVSAGQSYLAKAP
ncbi:MAG TPA: hypothetical protein VMJ65_12645 [Solirubrobacteraceae bacterium]|nr:hypothetical protein [Solirubrobacteraceae bacterium]